jgi:hypothetical protein
MTPKNVHQQPASEEYVAKSGDGERKKYSPPSLRSLGRVNVVTAATQSTEGSRRKPHG